MKILMVCLGNICRSPLAQGILESKVAHHGLDWQIDSAGTGSWHIGQQPDPRSVAIAKQYQIDISTQRARQVKTKDFEAFDILFAMDTQNFDDLTSLAPDQKGREKVRLIMGEIPSPRTINVPDPYWDDDAFENVFQMLDSAFDHFVSAHLKTAGV
ncbi:MAG: low molecular weight protein-tyrosine-phosphatase [Saprospiraceae bacterium]|jgi:protein-tyrosine phosphatase